MKKIIVIGSSGAGKSYFSRELSHKLNIKLYHLDRLMWQPNWQMTERSYQIQIQKEIIEKESWIIDGNYNGTMEMRMNASDTIIFFDINRWICFYQAIKRYFQFKGKTRLDMQEDCPERLDIDFLKFIWKYPTKQKIQVENRLDKVDSDKKIYVFKNKTQANHFLEKL